MNLRVHSSTRIQSSSGPRCRAPTLCAADLLLDGSDPIWALRGRQHEPSRWVPIDLYRPSSAEPRREHRSSFQASSPSPSPLAVLDDECAPLGIEAIALLGRWGGAAGPSLLLHCRKSVDDAFRQPPFPASPSSSTRRLRGIAEVPISHGQLRPPARCYRVVTSREGGQGLGLHEFRRRWSSPR